METDQDFSEYFQEPLPSPEEIADPFSGAPNTTIADCKAKVNRITEESDFIFQKLEERLAERGFKK